MQLIVFLLFFSILTLVSSAIICGFFKSSRGQWIRQVDGTKEPKGYILKGWYFFWFQEKDDKNYIQYEGERFRELAVVLMAKLGIQKFNMDLRSPATVVCPAKVKEFIIPLEEELEIKLYAEDVNAEEIRLSIFKVEPSYVFPEWVRDVMAGCITCHASVYGTLIFSIIHLVAKRSELEFLYSFADNMYMGIFFTWIAFVFALAYINTWLYKKLA